MSAPTPASPELEGSCPQPPAFGQPSPALIDRADRGYARFVARQAPADSTGHHSHDNGAGHQ
ncbi:hypothetical protein ACGFYF_39880 [Streptomyces lavendulae]|uniref:hypothetical protein n=1 Tax=Streptomyces lavendulae TaxID=1914 RepID=UPI00371D2993